VQMLLMVHLWVVTWSRSFCTVRVVKSLCGQWTLRPRIPTKCSEMRVLKILSLKQEDDGAISQRGGKFFSSVAPLRGLWRPPSPYLHGTAPKGGGGPGHGYEGVGA